MAGKKYLKRDVVVFCWLVCVFPERTVDNKTINYHFIALDLE